MLTRFSTVFYRLLGALVLLVGVVLPARSAEVPAIGAWDGVTPSARLETPYEDPRQANVPFGLISYFNQPWRSYMDTWSAQKYLDSMAAGWYMDAKLAEPMSQLLQETGIAGVRIEVGWGSMDWNDDFPANRKADFQAKLRGFRKYGIRPLVLLNANAGWPCPAKAQRYTLREDAPKGSREIVLDRTEGIVPHFTGPRGQAYPAAFPLIVAVDAATGRCTLSTPLAKDLKAGQLELITLKYHPLGGPTFADGTPNPEAQRSLEGWMKYVAAVCAAAKEAMATEGADDAGFDLEVWNEYTFGSQFLDERNYYDPPRQFKEKIAYTSNGRTQQGPECLLPLTVNYVNDPKNGLHGVRVISGFANQRPWENGSELWPGQAGFSRHYYTGGKQECSPTTPLGKPGTGVIDALGNLDGVKTGKDGTSVEPGSYFIPTFRLACPEYWHTGFKTELITRDLIPDSRLAYFRGHGRYTHNGDYKPAQVWETEVNYWRGPFFEAFFKDTGMERTDPRALALDQHMAGKLLLRQYLFHGHKGLYRAVLFTLSADPFGFGMLQPSFYAALKEANYTLTDAVRAQIPPEFSGLAWLTAQMRTGEALAAPRPLTVQNLVEYQPRLVFAGDGTPAHPHRWNRDQFACLPYQLSASKFVIPYYVVTLDVTHVYDATKAVWDPARYDMPEQEFDVTIGNVNGKGATVTGYDLLTCTAVPVQVVAATANTLTVRVKAVDYPRVLQVNEAQAGPQILNPTVALQPDGTARVTWKTNVPTSGSLTYGFGWQQRGATLVDAGAKRTDFSATIPVKGKAGVLAVRIRAFANGIQNVWPRWDEDPTGQVVLPTTEGQPAQPAAAAPAAPRAAGDFVGKQGMYHGNVLPTAAPSAWQFDGSETVTDHARTDGGKLVIDTAGDPTTRCAFRLGNWQFDDARGFTAELRVQVTAFKGGAIGNDHGFTLQVFGKQQLMQVDISPDRLAVRNGTVLPLDFATQPRTLRLVKHAGANLYDVYVDGQVAQARVPTIAAGGDRILWGDRSNIRGLTAIVDYLAVDTTGAWLPAAPRVRTPLAAVAGVTLPNAEVNVVRTYRYALPAGIVMLGSPDDREGMLNGVYIRARYLPGGMRMLEQYLPVTSISDTVQERAVTLPSGLAATLQSYLLDAAAHPGLANRDQRYLLVRRGGEDLLLLSIQGTPDAMKAQEKVIQAIFASVEWPD